MNACSDLQGLMAASLYGGLSAAEKEQLAQHLAACVSCSRELDELTRTAALLGSGHAPLPPAVRETTTRAILERVGGARTVRRARKSIVVKRTWLVPSIAAAAVVSVCIGLFIFARPATPPEETEPTAVAPPVPKPVPKPEPLPPPPAPKPPALEPEPFQIPPKAPMPAPEKKVAPVEPPVEKPETPAPEKPVEPAPPPKERVTLAVMAHVDQVQGEVVVVTDAGRVPAKPGLDLLPGQEIVTGPRASYVSLKGTDGTRLELSSDTSLRLVSDVSAASGRTYSIAKGVVAASVAKQPAGQPMLFKSPTAEAKVLGTKLVLDVATESTRLEVREGKVRLTRTDDGVGVDVAAGLFAVAAKGPAPAAHPDRPSLGLQALYRFRDGKGAIVRDSSGAGAPIDLRVAGMRAVTWTPDGLSLHGTTRIDSEAPAAKITDACRKSNELTLEAWVKPAKAAVDFDACILSLSTDIQDRNFALVQGDGGAKDVYSATLRTSETDGGGSPRLQSPRAATEVKPTHLVFTRTALGVEKLFVNGVVRATRTRGGTFATWNGAFRLILGNESFEERPWAGDYRLVAIYSRALTDAEVARIHKAGAE